MNKSLKVTFFTSSLVLLLTSTAIAQGTFKLSENKETTRSQQLQEVDQSQQSVQPIANETREDESSDKVIVYSGTLGICYEAELTCGEGGVEPVDYGQ
jgi:hypothetical protein